jgi:catechol 2,3-dioxygenase-like lactoylglutathione lyase family enzyme
LGNHTATKLDHPILTVNDRAKTIEFYIEILGLKYEGGREPFSVIRMTPEFQIQVAPWGTKSGEHIAFAMSRKEFDEVFRRPAEDGIEYGDKVWYGGEHAGAGRRALLEREGRGRHFNFFDPSRHLIEIGPRRSEPRSVAARGINRC